MASDNTTRSKGPVFWIVAIFCAIFVAHLVALGAIVIFTLLNPSSAEPAPQAGTHRPRIVEQSTWAGDFRPAVEVESSANHSVYKITSGETIYSIARKFDMETDELLKVNNITEPDNIPVGTRLRIPPGK